MSILKLRLSMIGTLAVIIAISTLFFATLLSLMGSLNVILLITLVAVFNITQWLVAPYIIDMVYGVREVSEQEMPWLHRAIERLCQKTGLKKPKVMISNLEVPNAFAYGSPIAGTRVAVTKGLLRELDRDEVEAVIGHELGHLKHRDVQLMMFVSLLPAIFYYLGYMLMMSAWYGVGYGYYGYGMRGEEERAGGGMLAFLIAIICMAIYWVLTLFTLHLSRLREYYADSFSALNVEGGARKLARALAKIVMATSKLKYRGVEQLKAYNAFKALFISDPDRAEKDLEELHALSLARGRDELVEKILRRKLTIWDRIAELFSTHPNIVKRIKALYELAG